MDAKATETPAWMACDEIVSKSRDELLSQAISVMREQIEKKRISLEGHLPTLTEGEGEKEKDMFLLLQLVKEHENIEIQFASYIREAQMSKQELSRVDELEKFLLSLRQIMMLYNYSRACESWLIDVEKELRERRSEIILARTALHDPQIRREILEHLLADKTLMKDNVFSSAEREIMSNALKTIKSNS